MPQSLYSLLAFVVIIIIFFVYLLKSTCQCLCCLGAGESGKSTIFKQARNCIVLNNFFGWYMIARLLTFVYLFVYNMQIKLLFQTGFDEAELKSYIPVIHANVYQTIKVRNT